MQQETACCFLLLPPPPPPPPPSRKYHQIKCTQGGGLTLMQISNAQCPLSLLTLLSMPPLPLSPVSFRYGVPPAPDLPVLHLPTLRAYLLTSLTTYGLPTVPSFCTQAGAWKRGRSGGYSPDGQTTSRPLVDTSRYEYSGYARYLLPDCSLDAHCWATPNSD